ncbi:hypothetical protein CHUAL_004706 [Chamberlinius hualienensis]
MWKVEVLLCCVILNRFLSEKLSSAIRTVINNIPLFNQITRNHEELKQESLATNGQDFTSCCCYAASLNVSTINREVAVIRINC